MSTWQISDRDTLEAILFDFGDSLTGLGTNWLGVHFEGEGPVGAVPSGMESDPTIFGILGGLSPGINLRSLSTKRGREYTLVFQWWSDPEENERVFRDFAQRWLTFVDGLSETGWTFFEDDAEPLPGVEFNAGLAARSIRLPAFAGAN